MALSGFYNQAAKRLLGHLNTLIKTGELVIRFPDGSIRVYGQPGTQPKAELHFHTWKSFRQCVSGGELGFAEAYMAEDIDCSGLYDFFTLIVKNRRRTGPRDTDNPIDKTSFRGFISWIGHLLRPNSKAGSRKNISAHYDLGNEFYAKWLDDSMTYSSALYGHQPELSLREAQDRKYANIIARGGFTPDSRVLEIGCGWGGFAEYAAKNTGCKVTGITISQEQFNYAAERIQKAGLNDKVELRMQDYRDVENGNFDGVASIEMFEAVGEKYWPVYFQKIRDVLKPGKKASLQIITIEDREFAAYRKSADFIQTYIFPGGMLPSLEALKKVTGKANLNWIGDTGFCQDYATTLLLWRDRFEAAWSEIEALGFDERFRRMWHFYLQYCAAGFDHGGIDVRQITLAR